MKKELIYYTYILEQIRINRLLQYLRFCGTLNYLTLSQKNQIIINASFFNHNKDTTILYYPEIKFKY